VKPILKPDVVIEAMSEAEWPAIAAIHREGIATGNATFTSEPSPSFAEFLAGKLPCGALTARERATGAVMGWTVLSRVSSRPVYAGVAEVGIYVASAARGRGVGTKLMRELIARSEAAGIWTLQAGIFEENAASLSLHLQHGFRIVGRRERIGRMMYGPRAGQWRDTLLLERRSAVVGAET
jgi:L-amino acid N-acyltransferase YncA